ncbi:hypothetical protein Cni_G27398 [Canna indica]|uniref:Uncharacterized protein n=1 Tax=Canna indica TaxID=4628 RepID=A0AAQ3QRC4_9LILI|nr:hypothetical protein Cni_G27398 [Canna indica]
MMVHGQTKERKKSSMTSFFPQHASSFDKSCHENAMKKRAIRNKVFSGPLVSIVPMEARRKRKTREGGRYAPPEEEEPTSPKVTCMGQIKLEKIAAVTCRDQSPSPPSSPKIMEEMPPCALIICAIFRRRKARGATDVRAGAVESGGSGAQEAPPIGLMRKFASCRESLRDFDWRKAAGECEEGEEEEAEAILPHSGPIMLGGGVLAPEPRKAVGLWKRRRT